MLISRFSAAAAAGRITQWVHVYLEHNKQLAFSAPEKTVQSRKRNGVAPPRRRPRSSPSWLGEGIHLADHHQPAQGKRAVRQAEQEQTKDARPPRYMMVQVPKGSGHPPITNQTSQPFIHANGDAVTWDSRSSNVSHPFASERVLAVGGTHKCLLLHGKCRCIPNIPDLLK